MLAGCTGQAGGAYHARLALFGFMREIGVDDAPHIAIP
jgi:hypothetical protein